MGIFDERIEDFKQIRRVFVLGKLPPGPDLCIFAHGSRFRRIAGQQGDLVGQIGGIPLPVEISIESIANQLGGGPGVGANDRLA